jgi:hypothetical protein
MAFAGIMVHKPQTYVLSMGSRRLKLVAVVEFYQALQAQQAQAWGTPIRLRSAGRPLRLKKDEIKSRLRWWVSGSN